MCDPAAAPAGRRRVQPASFAYSAFAWSGSGTSGSARFKNSKNASVRLTGAGRSCQRGAQSSPRQVVRRSGLSNLRLPREFELSCPTVKSLGASVDSMRGGWRVRVTCDPGAFVGRHLGGYEILSLLGAGGMGEVYRARDVKLGREVALKVLARPAGSDPAYLQRFEEEARLASALNHPNIVTIYGVGEEGDIAYIAMELVRGRTLREVLAERALRVGEVLDLAAPLADALAAAHASDIMHRDLKPENVMVTPEGLVKVLDFGLAKHPVRLDSRVHAQDDVATRAALTHDGMILGTVGYMSPEQAAGRPASLSSDQFSFGVILYEMCCGRRPFERDTSVETLSAIIREQPPAIQTVNPGVTFPIQQIVERCLAKQPGDRYANTRHLANELREIRDQWNRVSESGAAQALTAGLPETRTVADAAPVVSVTRRRALWLAGGALTTMVAGLGAWRLWPQDTGIRVLAVLPFANAAHDEEAEYPM